MGVTVEVRACSVAQAGLELVTFLPEPSSAGMTGMSHHTQQVYSLCLGAFGWQSLLLLPDWLRVRIRASRHFAGTSLYVCTACDCCTSLCYIQNQLASLAVGHIICSGMSIPLGFAPGLHGRPGGLSSQPSLEFTLS